MVSHQLRFPIGLKNWRYFLIQSEINQNQQWLTRPRFSALSISYTGSHSVEFWLVYRTVCVFCQWLLWLSLVSRHTLKTAQTDTILWRFDCSAVVSFIVVLNQLSTQDVFKWLVDWLTVWMTHWLINWLNDWLFDWLTGFYFILTFCTFNKNCIKSGQQ